MTIGKVIGLSAAMLGLVTAVPAGIDQRVLVVDGTGAAMGTVGNPLNVTGGGGGGGGGSLTNNNAVPGSANMGVLPAIANAANPSWSEGFQDLLSIDLAGNLRVRLNSLPTAAALADGAANPTTTGIGSFPMVWNGMTWDRWKDMAAAQAQMTFTGVPAMAPFYLDTTGTPSVRRGVTGASTTSGVNGTQVPGSASLIYDGTVFRPQSGDTSGRTILGPSVQTVGNVGGLTKNVDATLTRPANTTTYTAGDEMADTGAAIRTITSAALATGGSGIITHCLLSCSSNTTTTKPTFTVFVYDTTSTPQTDNAAFAPASSVQDTAVGYFTLSSAENGDATNATGNYTMDSGQIHIPFVTSGSANLFFRVKVTDAYTPGANSDTYKFRFTVQQDAK